MNLYKIQRDEQQKKANDFLNKFAFFAFSEEQFKAGLAKFNIQPGDTAVIVPLPGGGYILSERYDEFMDMIHAMQAERKAAIEDPETGAQFALDMFLEELANHEFTFTGDEWETLDALGIKFEDLESSETLRTALAKAKEILLQEDAELDLLDQLRKIEDEVYFEFGLNSNPGGESEEQMIEAMARRIIAEGLVDEITSGILEQLTAHNYHLVKRATEIAKNQ